MTEIGRKPALAETVLRSRVGARPRAPVVRRAGRRALAGLSVAIAVLLAGCGDDGEAGSEPDAAVLEAPADTEPAPAAPNAQASPVPANQANAASAANAGDAGPLDPPEAGAGPGAETNAIATPQPEAGPVIDMPAPGDLSEPPVVADATQAADGIAGAPEPAQPDAVETRQTEPETAIPDPVAVEPVEPDPGLLDRLAAADLDNGFRRAQRCTLCHALDDTPQEIQRTGPNLFRIVDAAVARAEDFSYSEAMAALGAAGAVWSAENLDRFLTDPAEALPGTDMSVAVVRDPQDRADLIAFLDAQTREPEEEPLISDALTTLLDRIAEADIAVGETIVAERCAGCHALAAGASTSTGPHLGDIVGRTVGAIDGFTYSQAFATLHGEDASWDYERLDAFLESPAAAIPGNRMGFSGLREASERAAVIAFLRTLSDNPMPLERHDLIALAGGEPRIGIRVGDLEPLVFRGRQSFGGQSLYNSQCAGCHGFTLAGLPEEGGPPLIGEAFAERWFSGPVWDLSEYVRREMAVGSAGLHREEYAEIIAYILEENGFAPGEAWLETSREELEAMGFYQY